MESYFLGPLHFFHHPIELSRHILEVIFRSESNASILFSVGDLSEDSLEVVERACHPMRNPQPDDRDDSNKTK